MHTNSLEAYDRLMLKLNPREQQILAVYRKHYPTPLSDNFIRKELGFQDMNQCRPRITSLKQKNEIIETGKLRDPDTGMNVRHCRLNQVEGSQMILI